MSLDIGYGAVRKDDGWVAFRYNDPTDADLYTYDSLTDLLSTLRKRFGEIEVGVREGFMAHEFLFTIYERPF